MPFGMAVHVGPDHIVLDGNPVSPTRGTADPQISAGVYCGQMAAWIKMPLGTKIGLSAGDIVLDDKYRQAIASSRVLYCGLSTIHTIQPSS